MANQLPVHLNLVAGALAGIVELCMMYPLDVIKTRAQQVLIHCWTISFSLLEGWRCQNFDLALTAFPRT